MAQPAWKRPGSPIGKKGRKVSPKYKRRSRQPCTRTYGSFQRLYRLTAPNDHVGLPRKSNCPVRSPSQRPNEHQYAVAPTCLCLGHGFT